MKANTRAGLAMTAVLACLFLALIVGLAPRDGMKFDISPPHAPTAGPSPSGSPTAAPPVVEQNPSDAGTDDGGRQVVQVLFILIALVVLMVIYQLTRRGISSFGGARRRIDKSRRDAADEAEDVDLKQVIIPAVSNALDLGVGTLRTTGTARNAIIEAWGVLVDSVEQFGLEPSAADTPTEFVVGLLEETNVETAPLRDFLTLYHHARFTDMPIADSERTRAIGLLELLQAELLGRAEVPTQTSLVQDSPARAGFDEPEPHNHAEGTRS
ncbi:DUF4129 domain-containing protein [Timonella senegalensis]|uniref:DUF4129 domain-containing protein n=1 Tax=Timonella senegalensis TaxID=1465825 RepID=UPI002FDD77E7